MRLQIVLAAILAVVGQCHSTAIEMTGTYGSFHTPNYPNVYGDNLVREWHITVREGYHIQLRFTDFDLEDSYEEEYGPCVYDYVKLSEKGKTIGRFCGNYLYFPIDAPTPGEWFYSENNTMTIKFVSDYSNEDITPSGFSAHYVEMDDDECAIMRRKELYTFEDWDELVTCNHFCNNVPGSYYCSCRSGFTLHSNKHTCVATFCEHQVLDGDQGVIESPEYPQPYAKLSYCTWDIRVRDGLSVHIKFERLFEIEEHDEEGCVYDILKLTYNDDQITYCGTMAPQNGSLMDMNTKNVRIEFKTDLSVEMAGFKLSYNTSRIRCLKPLSNPRHGEIVTDFSKDYREFEDVVEFRCNKGYDLIGVASLECLSDGTWSHAQPTCKIKSCGVPTKLKEVKYSSILNYTSLKKTYGEILTVKCNDWYEMIAGTRNWNCTDRKQWEEASGNVAPNLPGNLPVCSPICGIKGSGDNHLLSQHIADGIKSLNHEWPWMVFLNFGRERHLLAAAQICGGSLISPNFVLTAAHCVNASSYPGDIRFPNHTHVWLGVHSRTADPSTVKYVQAKRIIAHPKYFKTSMWNYDVALIELQETVVMSEEFRPVCLPKDTEAFDLVQDGRNGEIAGWGLYSSRLEASNTLLHAEFGIVTKGECWQSFVEASERTHTRLPQGLQLTENMFCAGTRFGGQSTCGGDSGGPFVMTKTNSSTYYAVGLVSFGIGRCGKIISYTGYTKLNKEIVDWISENTNNLQ